MGAINSLIDTPGGYSVLQKNSETRHCRFCGSAYNDVCTKDIQTSRLEDHHPAELCGIWLGKLYSNQMKEIRLHGDFRALSASQSHCAQTEGNFESVGSPLVTLPKRSCAPTRSHVATLLRHSDTTKNQSTLKDFFSTMDIRNSSSVQYTELEGCHINGCLFVEHGNLVFQAVSKRSHVPFLLIDQQMLGPTSDCVAPIFHQTNKGRFFDNPKLHCPIQRPLPILSFPENGSHLGNSDTVGQKCSPSLVDNPYISTERCPEDVKPRLPPPPLRLSWPLVTLRRFGFYGNSLFKVETGRRAPRGEGLYLFRIKHLREFRKSFEIFTFIEALMFVCCFSFGHTFVKQTCVHQHRDNLSVHQLSTAISESRSLLRSNNNGKLSLIMPFNKIFHKQSSISLSTTPMLHDSINEKIDRNLFNGRSDHKNITDNHDTFHHYNRPYPPVLSERNNLAFSFDDTEIDLLQSQTIKLTNNNKIQQKQEHHDRVSSNCLHWLQLQNSSNNFGNNENNQHANNDHTNSNHCTKLQNSFKYSCPQLSDIASVNPINCNDDAAATRSSINRECHHVGKGYCQRSGGSYFSVHRSNNHHSCCLDKDTKNDTVVDIDECIVNVNEDDEISNLPEAPLPPLYNNSSYCDIIQGQSVCCQRIYDNLIAVNNGVNNCASENDNDNCCCSTVRRSSPSMTTPATPTVCFPHQLSNEYSDNNNISNVAEIDKKASVDEQTLVDGVGTIVLAVERGDSTSSFGEQKLAHINACNSPPVLLKKSLSSDINLPEIIDKPSSIIPNNTTATTSTNSDNNNDGFNSSKEHDVMRKFRNKSQTLILSRLPSTSSKIYLHSRHASLPNPNTCSNTVIIGDGISSREHSYANTGVNHSRQENLSFRVNKKIPCDYLCKIHRNLSNSSDRKNSDMLDMITEYSPYYNLSTSPQTLTQIQCTGLCTSQTITSSLPGENNQKCIHSSSVSCLPTANYPVSGDNISRMSYCSSYSKESPIQTARNQPSPSVASSSVTISTNISVTTNNNTATTSPSIATSTTTTVPRRTGNLGCHNNFEKPTSMLHYATLDFGIITPETSQYRNESYSDMNAVRWNNNIHDIDNTHTGSSRNQKICSINNTVTNANNNNSHNNLNDSYCSRIYGTLTDTLHSHSIESPCHNHFSGHTVSSNNSVNCEDIIRDESDADLPSNYVAICQLQTLAMRAVLSATT
ncbi:hypothetical protein Smp_158670 [Schistosoma mansoni]|uniref:hypothetical protein n=1 Tax=Schistosoma mansoni TaxID=6183 RepID=UPI0001A62A91|nr:hypothetical protein Smp_158670 [Schistosoma mansoni]|eukprot:XP_018646560.1 hypothetical protein Smp_158670 [Schistosoma mansoni]